jgi:exosortase/archaeosortase family protein
MIHWLSQWLTAITNRLTEALLYVSRTLFEWYFGVKPTVDATNGAYVYDVLQVQIDTSCAGISFFGYTLLLLAVLGYQRSGVSGLVASPLFAFSLAAMGNSVRLIASVYIQEIGDLFLPSGPHYRLHEWLGYLIFGGIWLILVLWATKKKKGTRVCARGRSGSSRAGWASGKAAGKATQEALQDAFFHRPDQRDYSGAPVKAPK